MIMMSPARPARFPSPAVSDPLRHAAGPADRAPRPLTAEMCWIGAGAALLVLLQVLALGERNPLTRTLSSYEYTTWGWMFPVSLVIFGIGVLVLALRLDRTARLGRALLFGSAVASWVTAVFPSGSAPGGGYWPGEVHRWGSIGLTVLALAAGLALLRPVVPARSRAAVVRVVFVGSAGGLAFLMGQTLKPAVPAQLGLAPLAGGLTQRVLVVAVAVLLLMVAGYSAERRAGSAERRAHTGDAARVPAGCGAAARDGAPVR